VLVSRRAGIATVSVIGLMLAGGIVLLLVANLGSHRPAVTGESTSRLAPPRPAPTPAGRSGLKAAIHGLLYLRGQPPAGLRPMLAGYVVEGSRGYGAVSWAELQEVPGGAITPENPIDRAIADVRAWNAANPQHPEVLKVRIQAGIHSPAWAMNLGGPCAQVKGDPYFGVGGCTPRFWTGQFAAAFYQFEGGELAARYDRVPEIAEVIIARNMTIYNEPALRQIADPGSVVNLLAAG
jgi:hypothetical protein